MNSVDYLIKRIKENKFLIIGRVGIDIYPDPPGTKTENAEYFISHLGGSSANIAVAISKLGGNCKILTCISDDALGRLSIKHLNNYGVDTSLVKTIKGEARISLAVVETTIKDHQSIIYRNGAADLFMKKEDIDKVNFDEFSILIFTGTTLASEPSRSAMFYAMEIAKKFNIPIILDIDYRPYTWKSSEEASEIYLYAAKFCNVIIGNDDEFGILAKDYNKGIKIAKELNNTSKIIIYKKGDKGSLTFNNDLVIKKGIFNVDALKPTGAGDAFMGGFIGGLLNGNSLDFSIELGSAAAAIVVTKVGCAPAMPNMNEIEDFIKINKISNYVEN